MARLEAKKIISFVSAMRYLKSKNISFTKTLDFVDSDKFVGVISLLSLIDIFYFDGTQKKLCDANGIEKEYYVKKYSYSEIGFLAVTLGASVWSLFTKMSSDTYQIITSALGAAEILGDAIGLSAYGNEEIFTSVDNVEDTISVTYSL